MEETTQVPPASSSEETSKDFQPLPLSYHVTLSADNVVFEPQHGKIFFDEGNGHLLTVSETELSLYSLPDGQKNTLRIQFSGGLEALLSVKLSPDRRFLTLHRSDKRGEIQFFALDGEQKFSQKARKAQATGPGVLEFHWTYPDNIFLVTSFGVELYQVPDTSDPSFRLGVAKKGLKLLKEYKCNMNWFVYSPSMHVLLMSSGGRGGNVLQGIYFKQNTINKLPKFEIELRNKENETLHKEDITLCKIYGRLFCVHLQRAEKTMTLYQITRESVTKRLTINLRTSGVSAIQVVDNLLLVHDSESKISMLFDIKDRDIEFPVASPLPLAPFIDKNGQTIPTYTERWGYYEPNYIIDFEHGYLWQAQLNLKKIMLSFAKRIRLVEFLLRRAKSRDLLLSLLKTMVEDCTPLSSLSKIFDIINIIARSAMTEGVHADEDGNSLSGYGGESERAESSEPEHSGHYYLENSIPGRSKDGYVIVDQIHIYKYVFLPIDEGEKTIDNKFFAAVLTEYIRSLNFHQIPVEHYLHKLMISLLLRHNQFYQLHQFLQYHVINDSIHVACQLLSLEKTYPPAYQLALDMLKRLSAKRKSVEDQIVEVLLTRNQFLPALRFIRSHKDVNYSVARFLEATHQAGDETLFYTVFKFFERRGEINPANQDVKKYIQLYDDIFLKANN
ncbi:Mic1 domain-containing protein [Balamuthia mandrillaris]